MVIVHFPQARAEAMPPVEVFDLSDPAPTVSRTG
jgi:hypothetical protein